MSIANVVTGSFRWLRAGLASLALCQLAPGQTVSSSSSLSAPNDGKSNTAIKHVIVIIGENRSFDHVFATYQPKNGQSVWNLLSQGIIKANGAPGPNFGQAAQTAATDKAPDTFLLSPFKGTFPNGVLPAPLAGGPTSSYVAGKSLSLAEASENGLPTGSIYYQYSVSGGTGLTSGTPDTRITNVNSLQPGPFQLTGGEFTYNSYAASPVHRFYQMWQQLDCGVQLLETQRMRLRPVPLG